MASFEIVLDMDGLQRAVAESEDVAETVSERVKAITGRANAMSAGFRTGLYHRDHKSPAVGDTQPDYKGDVRKMGRSRVGIVYTGNYAAQKDNHLHNTLLKSI